MKIMLWKCKQNIKHACLQCTSFIRALEYVQVDMTPTQECGLVRANLPRGVVFSSFRFSTIIRGVALPSTGVSMYLHWTLCYSN